MAEHECVLCQTYRPGSEPHAADRPQTCPSGRRRLERDRLAVRALFLRLAEQEDEIIDGRVGDRKIHHYDGTTTVLVAQPRDPVAYLLPMAPTAGRGKAPTVSGSKEKQLPISVMKIDLLAPATPWEIVDEYGDQVGVRSVATVLWHWVDRWQLRIYATTVMAPVEAIKLLDWVGPRLDRICDEDPDVGAFAEALIALRRQLQQAVGDAPPRMQVMWGVPCRRCDTVSSLVLNPEDPDAYRECTNPGCGLLLTEDEYLGWVVSLTNDPPRRPQNVVEGACV